MIINNHNTDEQVYVIAEIGNNHEGSFELAKELITLAFNSGVNAVKFQTFQTHLFVSEKYNPERYQQLSKYALSFDQFTALYQHANELGIDFIATPFDLESARFLEDKVVAYKIASSDLTFYPMIEMLAKTNKPLIFSTAFHDLVQIQETLQFISKFRKISKDNVAILHCVGNYPTLPEDAQLRSIDYLKSTIENVEIGYSDHTIGNLGSTLAVAKGARIIEKHFTIDHNYSNFHDHKISANPSEMKELVTSIRMVDVYSGTFDKIINTKEFDIKKLVTRRIVAKQTIPSGKQISLEDITWIRLDNGFKAGEENLILGKTAKVDIASGDVITSEMI
jgi:N,N'-diacetyllegionaminate synthase